MAKKTTKNDQVEYQGESQSGESGYGSVANPPNPSDAIFLGRSLMTVPAQDVTGRRDFAEPVRPPLHYSDGCGPDERVSSRRPAIQGDLGDVSLELDHYNFTPPQGVDKQPYSHGDNPAYTSNGVEIRGT